LREKFSKKLDEEVTILKAEKARFRSYENFSISWGACSRQQNYNKKKQITIDVKSA